MHYIQSRLSMEDGLGRRVTFESVSDDGTIVFTDGTRLWNHDPVRVRALVALRGREMRLGTRGVLRIPDDGGWSCVSVTNEPDPCRPETAETRPGESILDEMLRRGGVVRSLQSVLDELDETD